MAKEQDCGFYGFYPRWLRNRATSKLFIVVYGLLGTIQAMSFIYVVVTLTTLEKRFKIPSRTTGIILSGNEISQVLSLILIYYGGSGHRPRWIAVGVGFSAASCLVLALPHFIYGPGKDALALTKEYLDQDLLNVTAGPKEILICPRIEGSESCDEGDLSDISLLPRLLVFLSQFILGIGTTLYYGLGQSYLDDNTKKKNTPMLLGFTYGLRTIGPVFGFLLGYLCLSLYIDPTLHPVITQKDPRWLGAWWLGWIILGFTMGIFAILIAMFPRELPKPKLAAAKQDGEIPLKVDLGSNQRFSGPQEVMRQQEIRPTHVPTLKDFPKALKRLFTNRIILCNNVGAVSYILGVSGFITFLAKYLEVQYGTSAAGGTAIAGPISLLGMVLGFLVSGIVISKFKPSPRIVLGWNVLVGISYFFITITYSFLGCPDTGFQGLDQQSWKLNLSSPCNAGCGCDGIKYSPVCHESTGTTFYSACHAGCRTTLDDNKFGSCACIPALEISKLEDRPGFDQHSKTSSIPSSETYPSGLSETVRSSITMDDTVKAGPCPRDCGVPYLWFIVLTAVIQMFACSGKIGNVLVNYRAVSTEDKSIAQGFAMMFISLFGLIPGPIIYGALIDSTCLIWEESCGEKGNCWFYHKDNFRYMINFTGAGFIFFGICFDCVVWYIAKDLDLYGSLDEDKRREFVMPEHLTSPSERKVNPEQSHQTDVK